jgi:hypothetical protein
MKDARLSRPRAEVKPRFRCLVCKVFVVGGEDGTCPRCGWRPPEMAAAPRVTELVIPGWLAALVVAGAVAAAAAWLATGV